MKTNVFLTRILLTVMLSNSLIAQEGNFGDDPENCRVNLSTYTEFFNQKNYTDAMPAWRWCFVNCPEATRNIYIHGTTIIENFIADQTDE